MKNKQNVLIFFSQIFQTFFFGSFLYFFSSFKPLNIIEYYYYITTHTHTHDKANSHLFFLWYFAHNKRLILGAIYLIYPLEAPPSIGMCSYAKTIQIRHLAVATETLPAGSSNWILFSFLIFVSFFCFLKMYPCLI